MVAMVMVDRKRLSCLMVRERLGRLGRQEASRVAGEINLETLEVQDSHLKQSGAGLLLDYYFKLGSW
jgi:hypothetical protein